MDVDISPKLSQKVCGSDGGSYFGWCPKELPMLEKADIGAAKLALEKGGLALPSYSDSAKVAYVLQGSGTCGITLPEVSKEKVLPIKAGDAIALPFGVLTWWYNKDDTELVVLFMGDTAKGHRRGVFTNFQITGTSGIFTGFTPEFVSRAWDLPEDQVKQLVASQTGCGIVKVKDGQKMPEPNPGDREGMVLNCLEAPLDVDIKDGGRVVVLNTKNLPLVGEVGLGADLVVIDGFSMCSPGFSCDSAFQVTYIVKGSGTQRAVTMDIVCSKCGSLGFAERIVTCAACRRISEHTYCMQNIWHNDPSIWKCEDCTANGIEPPTNGIEPPKRRHTVLLEDAPNETHVKRICTYTRRDPKKLTGSGRQHACTQILRAPCRSSAQMPRVSSADKRKISDAIPRLGALSAPTNSANIKTVSISPATRTTPLSRAAKTSNTQSQVMKRATCASLQHALPKFDVEAGSCDKERNANDCKTSGNTECSDNNNFPWRHRLILDRKHPHRPLPNAYWRGDFKISDMSSIACHAIQGIRAYIAGVVSPNVYETARGLHGKTIELKLCQRMGIWPKVFRVDPPDFDDVGLYFFPSEEQRSKVIFKYLVDMLDKQDFAMQSHIDNAELLIFTSAQLPQDPHAIGVDREVCLWGVFRRIRTINQMKADQRKQTRTSPKSEPDVPPGFTKICLRKSSDGGKEPDVPGFLKPIYKESDIHY